MYNNYLVNGKPLGFSCKDNLQTIIMEVLGSYLPIKPNDCMLTGKPILTQPRILLLDGDSQNVLFSNLVITNTETKFETSLVHEVMIKLEKGISIRVWKSDEYPFLYEDTLRIVRKTCFCEVTNPIQLFLDLIYNGAKGIISVSVNSSKDRSNPLLTYVESETETVHYQDILKYRMLNQTNIESTGH